MQPIEVYYDGLCQLCSREVNLIKKWSAPGQMQFIDIMDAGFDAPSRGIDPVYVHKHMHVRDSQGQMQIGLNALITMWEVTPYFRHLARITKLPGVYQLSKLGYAIFAWIRPKLPRRKCVDGNCSVR